jgi:ABC-type transport system substrate-binding protein
MRTCSLVAALVAVSSALLLAASGTAYGVKEGGTFTIGLDSDRPIDPALTGSLPGAPECGTLLTGPRLRPDLAEAEPAVSRDGKTYTFTIRKNARFSSGAAVTARAFARALVRIRDPELQSPLAGNFEDVRDIDVNGRTLTLKLTRPQPLLLAFMTELCAVPPNLPVDAEGAKAPLPSAGPYYVAEYVPGERLRLERNRFYNGTRARHVDRFVAELGADQGSLVDDIASGTYDWGGVNASSGAARAAELARRYGFNKEQYWIKPGLGLRLFHLNTNGRLFRHNPKLRQAVNFAIDRRALTRELGPFGGRATDQYLLPVMPGYRDERIYPWKPRYLKKARALAKGNLRSGKAVLYTPDRTLPLATAQIVKRNLAEIGLEVEIKEFPPIVAFEKMTIPREPFDIGYIGLSGPFARDPSLLSFLFDGRTIGQVGNGNRSHLNSPTVNRLLDEASRLSGPARYRAYAELDIRLSRDVAPAIPWAALNDIQFVSPRVGCVTFNPLFDLTGVCLK